MIAEFFFGLPEQVQSLIMTVPMALLAIICHEYAHGWVSWKLGDPTARDAGRLSWNPLKHLDPVGTLCMIFFRIGWANPVPIDPRYYKNPRKGIILVSLAGPGANVIVAFISMLLMGLLLRFGSRASFGVWLVSQMCYLSAVMNIGLCLFNLVPIPPLDGSKVVGMLHPAVSKFYWRLRKYWRVILVVCVFTRVLTAALGTVNGWVFDGLWAVARFLVGA